MSDLDPKLTFESFVVGPANRLASAAARRAADSPGTSYNPLFVYSASGLGKTHILTAIAHQATKAGPDRKLEYMALEKYLERLEAALARLDPAPATSVPSPHADRTHRKRTEERS